MENQIKPDYSECPSLQIAYELGVKLSEQQARRYDTIESRSNAFITAILTLNVAVVTIVSQHSRAEYNHWAFVLAMILLTASVVTAMIRRFFGNILLPNMREINQHFVSLPNDEFFANMCFRIAEQQMNNDKVNNACSIFASVAFVIALVEVAALVVWVASVLPKVG